MSPRLRETIEAKRQRLAAQGVKCGSCSRSLDGSSTEYCSDCLAKRRVSKKLWAERRRQEGLCSCGKPLGRGTWHCDTCLDEISLRMLKLKLRREHKGLCGYCGKGPPDTGKILCVECRGKRTRATRRRQRKREVKRKDEADARRTYPSPGLSGIER